MTDLAIVTESDSQSTKFIVVAGDSPINGTKGYQTQLKCGAPVTLSGAQLAILEQELDDFWSHTFGYPFSQTERVLRTSPRATARDILGEALQKALARDVDSLAYIFASPQSCCRAIHLVCMLDLFEVTTGVVVVEDQFGIRDIPGSVFLTRF